MKIVKDKQHTDMYRVQWPDGTISVNTPYPDREGGHYGFYNKARAKEFLKRKDIENYQLGITYNASVAA